jgi:hypothetical protein
MAETTGTISFLKVNKEAAAGADFGLFGVRPPSSTDDVLFFIWFTLADREPAPVTAWIARNMHVAMLRDALAQKLTVTVSHDPTSSFYRALQVNGP